MPESKSTPRSASEIPALVFHGVLFEECSCTLLLGLKVATGVCHSALIKVFLTYTPQHHGHVTSCLPLLLTWMFVTQVACRYVTYLPKICFNRSHEADGKAEVFLSVIFALCLDHLTFSCRNTVLLAVGTLLFSAHLGLNSPF